MFIKTMPFALNDITILFLFTVIFINIFSEAVLFVFYLYLYFFSLISELILISSATNA